MISGPSASIDSPRRSLADLVSAAKCAYTTRRVDLDRAVGMITAPDIRPRSGDLLLAEVGKLGQHKRLELRTGRRAALFSGDVICVAYGARYAPDQFLAQLPTSLQPCQLVAAGGLAGSVKDAHDTMADATAITPLGILVDAAGHRLNVADHAVQPASPLSTRRAPTLAVVGSSMNSGKTTAAASLIRGLRDAGYRVGAAKITGTGAGGDTWLYADSGAERIYDFIDGGVASTFGWSTPEICRLFDLLLTQLAADGTDVNVIEVADGLHHAETAALLRDPFFGDHVDGVVYTCRDSLSAISGLDWLAAAGLPVLCLGGLITAAPLAIAETRTIVDSVPVAGSAELSNARYAAELVAAGSAQRQRRVNDQLSSAGQLSTSGQMNSADQLISSGQLSSTGQAV